MKYLFIGDIHNNYKLMKKIADYGQSNEYHMVFVGDYVDDWDNKAEDGIKCLDLAIELSKDHTFILGNHDIAYLFPEHHWVYGAQKEYIKEFSSRLNKIDHQLSFCVDNILCTHAGLDASFYPQNFIYKGNTDLNQLTNWIELQTINITSPLLKSGAGRSGRGRKGGITWCDFYDEFEPIADIIQVFGHTKTRKERKITMNTNDIGTIKSIDIIEEGEKDGFTFAKRNFFGNIFYFYKSMGIDCLMDDDSKTPNYNIDNLEYGEGELLSYSTETKEFNFISRSEYEN